MISLFITCFGNFLSSSGYKLYKVLALSLVWKNQNHKRKVLTAYATQKRENSAGLSHRLESILGYR